MIWPFKSKCDDVVGRLMALEMSEEKRNWDQHVNLMDNFDASLSYLWLSVGRMIFNEYARVNDRHWANIWAKKELDKHYEWFEKINAQMKKPKED